MRSPKHMRKYNPTPTTNQGVEAKESELVNSELDNSLKLNIGSLQSEQTSSPRLIDEDLSTLSNCTSAPISQDSASYIQVVVKKHPGKRKPSAPQALVQHVASQTSSPQRLHTNKKQPNIMTTGSNKGTIIHKTCADYGVGTEVPSLYVLPHHMLLASYPPVAQCVCQSKNTADVGISARSSSEFKKIVKKEFPQRTQDYVAIEKTAGIDQITVGSRQWLQNAISKYKLGAYHLADSGPDKMEVYLLDRGTQEYFNTTDRAPLTVADALAVRADAIATRFWAEVFGLPHLAMAFITAFVLQMLRSVLSGAIRPLMVGTLQTTSDYLLKPALAVCFNALLQPPLLLLLNVLSSIRDAMAPLAGTIGDFLKPLVNIVQSFKPITVGTDKYSHVV